MSLWPVGFVVVGRYGYADSRHILLCLCVSPVAITPLSHLVLVPQFPVATSLGLFLPPIPHLLALPFFFSCVLAIIDGPYRSDF